MSITYHYHVSVTRPAGCGWGPPLSYLCFVWMCTVTGGSGLWSVRVSTTNTHAQSLHFISHILRQRHLEGSATARLHRRLRRWRNGLGRFGRRLLVASLLIVLRQPLIALQTNVYRLQGRRREGHPPARREDEADDVE